jgi:hypothetical protein
MERKTMMGLAAVAGAVALLYMRSRSASAATAGTGGVLTSNSSWLNSAMGNTSSGWGANPVQIIVNTKHPTPVDDVAKSPPPAPAGVPAEVIGGAGGDDIGPVKISNTGYRTYADGSGRQLTPEEQHVINLQAKGKMPTFGM